MRKETRKAIVLTIILLIVSNIFIIGCRLQANTKAESLDPETKTETRPTKTENSNGTKTGNTNANSHPIVDQKADEDFWLGSYAHDRVESDPGDGFVSLDI